MASGSVKVIIAAFFGNLLVAITKFIAAAITNSSAMLSEGIHSSVDSGNQLLLLYGEKRAKKPADNDHPFGYGKEIYFWAFIVAILIFALGAGVSFYEGIHRVMHPAAISKPYVNYIVLCLAIVFEAFSWWIAFKEFRKGKGDQGYLEALQKDKNPTIFVVLFEDSAAMIGLFVALGGVIASQVTGNPVYDGVAAIIIGVILSLTALWLAFETKGLLIGEGAKSQTVKSIRSILEAKESIEHVNEVLTLHMGPNFILVNISVDFKGNILSDELEAEIVSIDKEIKDKHELVKRVFVEAEARKLKLDNVVD